MTKEKIIKRVAKLLALSASPEPAEAAAALEKANELMEEYGIKSDDLLISDVAESAASVGRQIKTPPKYIAELAAIISSLYGLEVIYRYTVTRKSEMVFIGFSPQVEIASYVFTVMLRKLVSMRRRHIKLLRGKRSNRSAKADMYAAGWTAAVYLKIRNFQRPVSNAIRTYYKNFYPELVDYNPRKRKARAGSVHFFMGFQDGKNAELHNGLTVREKRLLTS